MDSLARHIIAVANQNNKAVTNLQLHKVMFFTIGLDMRINGVVTNMISDLYNVPFEKWKYGACVESLYYKYNLLSKQSLTECGDTDERFSHMDQTIINLLDVDVFTLIRLMRTFDSWSQHGDKIEKLEYVEPYTLDEIYKDFVL
jgi:uncharacterized phage-associated protein